MQLLVSGKIPQGLAAALATIIEIGDDSPRITAVKNEGGTRVETTIPQFTHIAGVFPRGGELYQLAFQGNKYISELREVEGRKVWLHTVIMQKVGIPVSGDGDRVVIEDAMTASFREFTFYCDGRLPRHFASVIAQHSKRPLPDCYESFTVNWQHNTTEFCLYAIGCRQRNTNPEGQGQSREIIEGVWSNFEHEGVTAKRKFTIEIYAKDADGNII